MKKIEVGPQVKGLLRALAENYEFESSEPLSAEEWEAACTIMGVQVAFRGELPLPVHVECQNAMAEVALRTGLPLHLVDGRGPEVRH